MKKLRLFDSLKFVRFVVAVACMFAIMPAHAAILPAGYTELEYLESTGEQYVELSFGFDPTDMILADLSVNIEESSDKYMVAPKVWNSNHNKFAMGVHQGVYTIAYQNMTTGGTGLIPPKRNDGQIHKWIYGGYVFSIPELNTSRDVSDITFGTTTSNIRLFYGYNGGTAGKISYYKHVKANGTSVELIPVRRDSDGVLGMYDLADSNPATAFHTNAGTGEFVAGPAAPIKIATTRYNEQQFAPVQNELSNAMDAVDDVVTRTMSQAQAIDQIATSKQTRPDEGCTAKYCLLVEDEDGTPHWYPIAGANGVAHNLPAGYTELQYIESTGTQYIDTGYIPNSNTRWELDNEYTDTPPAKHFFNGLYQTATGFQPARFDIALQVSGITLNYGISNVVNSNTSSFINTRYTYVVDAKNNKWAYNDTTGSFPSYSNMTTITKSLYLFARNDMNGVDRFCKQRTYSSKIYDDGILVRDFIPAKRNSDNEIGMYDLADPNPATAFHTNAGTGEFVAGPDM